MYKNTKQYDKDIINGNKMCLACDETKDLSHFHKFCSNKVNCFKLICNECCYKGIIDTPSKIDVDNRRGWKICTKCNEKKDLTNFSIDYRFNIYSTLCSICGNKKTNRNRNKRRKNNPNYKIRCNLGYRIKRVLNGERKSAKTMELVGCSLEEFFNYIESIWLEGMTWENHGFGDDKWHFNYKLPTSLFDLTDTRQQKWAFNYTNMQPLWQSDNISKNDKLPNGKRVQDMSKDEKLAYLKELGYKLD